MVNEIKFCRLAFFYSKLQDSAIKSRLHPLFFKESLFLNSIMGTGKLKGGDRILCQYLIALSPTDC